MKVLKIGIIVFLLILISSPGLGSGSNNIREGLDDSPLKKATSIVVKSILQASKPANTAQNAIDDAHGYLKGRTPEQATADNKTNIYIYKKIQNTRFGKVELNVKFPSVCHGLFGMNNIADYTKSTELSGLYLLEPHISRIKKISGIQDDGLIKILSKKYIAIFNYLIHKDLINLNMELIDSNEKLPEPLTVEIVARSIEEGNNIVNKYLYNL